MVAKLVFYYIFFTLRQGIPPWRFFQLNAEYFNSKKGIFSKIEIDQYIPKKWRLAQFYLDKNQLPKQYPVFIKPEWGQNGYGISVVYNQDELTKIANKDHKVPYIVQHLAVGKQEYEIFYIQDPNNHKKYITLTITQVINTQEKYPINSIYNKHTQYIDITCEFTKEQQNILKRYLAQMPCFRIARIAVKTQSQQTLLVGEFKIIEINLFTPFPLNLLDKNHHSTHRQFIKDNMRYLATLSGKIPKKDFKPFLFFKKVRKHYQIQF